MAIIYVTKLNFLCHVGVFYDTLLLFQTLANLTTDAHFAEGRVYPPLADIREVSTKIAAAVVDYAYKRGMASTYPEPEDKEAFVRMHMYNLDYENFLPTTYGWPGMPE